LEQGLARGRRQPLRSTCLTAGKPHVEAGNGIFNGSSGAEAGTEHPRRMEGLRHSQHAWNMIWATAARIGPQKLLGITGVHFWDRLWTLSLLGQEPAGWGVREQASSRSIPRGSVGRRPRHRLYRVATAGTSCAAPITGQPPLGSVLQKHRPLGGRAGRLESVDCSGLVVSPG
jgi:hypothetical protein